MLPAESKLHRFLERALFRLELATYAVLLLLALAQPTLGRTGIPTWALIALATGYALLVELARHRVPWLRPLPRKYILEAPATALVYFLGAGPGGALFVLFFLAVVCAAASMTLRGGLLYTAVVAAIVAGIDPTFPGAPSASGDVRELAPRVVLLAVFWAGTAILTRRLTLEQEAARVVRDEAARLAELDRLRTDFISTMSHDLQTPLSAAWAGLGMLEGSLADRVRPDERELLGNVGRNVERLRLLIDDLLAFNQLEAGTLRLDRELLDLRDVAADAAAALGALVREKRQTLHVDLPDPLPVAGDWRRLEQAIVNLLANAHRHTPSGTRIAVTGRATAGELLLAVGDNGPGIPAAEYETIFRRFHRLPSAEGGSGLGLAIARGIVELHGGRIWVESEPGRGATFRLALPRSENGGEP